MADEPIQPAGQPEGPKGEKPPPRCKAILLAEHVIVDALTGRISVIGIIDKLMMPRFPTKTRPMWAFLLLTDGIGRYDIVVEVENLTKNTVIGRGTGIAVEFKQKLSRCNVIIPLPPIALEHPGPYDVVVIANGQEIDRQQFVADQPRGPDENDQQPPPGQ